MVGAKSVFTYALFMTFPALIFPGYLITNGMRDEASYGTPFVPSLCSKNISPWSDVNTTIVLSSKPLSSRNLRILPTLSSMCFYHTKILFQGLCIRMSLPRSCLFSLPFPQLGLCDAYSGFIVNGISGFRFFVHNHLISNWACIVRCGSRIGQHEAEWFVFMLSSISSAPNR